VSAPADLLREIHIVDTPGTNAVIREHEEITSQFVPRADLVLFVTSADRPFTETERAFLEQISDWGKKVVVVINKVDILAGEKELGEVRAYVADNARRLLGVTPEIFPVSAKAALRRRKRAGGARRAARDLPGQREGGFPRKERRAAAVDVERLRGAGAIHPV